MNWADLDMKKIIIVGSGLFGLTMANLIADTFKIPVKVLERRNHIGGNAWSHFDKDTGIEVHDYGSHIFHTSSAKVIDFISQFAEFTQYKHTVWAKVDAEYYSMPFNLQTISTAYSKSLSPSEAKLTLAQEISESGISEEMSHLNLENKAIFSIGKTLYEKLVLGYTENSGRPTREIFQALSSAEFPSVLTSTTRTSRIHFKVSLARDTARC